MKPLVIDGNEISFRYLRVMWSREPYSTLVEVSTKHGEKIKGVSECSPKDQFSKEVGRKIALKRALSSSELLTKDDKKAIWDGYRDTKPNKRW